LDISPIANVATAITVLTGVIFGWFEVRHRRREREERAAFVPLAMVDDMMGGIVRVIWRKMERYVMHDRARSGSQKGWEWFQWLFVQLERHNKSKTSLRFGAFDAHREWKP